MSPSRSELSRFIFHHGLLVPAGLALAAFVAEASGLDWWVSNLFYDAGLGVFPAHESAMLELFGHRLGKSLIFGMWFCLLLIVLAGTWLKSMGANLRVWQATLLAMVFGPAGVVLLKGLNNRHCPWDLKGFGGDVNLMSDWFVSAADAGHCFPSGHASAGFSLVAFMFAGKFLGNARLARIGLMATVLAGGFFSVVRIAQGAHFLSHNLWSAAICWCVAAFVFGVMLFPSSKKNYAGAYA